VDFNEVNPNRAGIGAFTVLDDGPADGPAGQVGERYIVVARAGLRLREGPGTQFDVVGGLRHGQLVFVTSIADGWVRVDVEGDGLVDGFASAGFLEPV
jgi:uncharacterized protein YgiM (DUF1202 family)